MVWFNVCGASLDNCSNVGCVDIFLTSVVSLLIACMVFVFLGSWSYFRELLWDLRTKLCCIATGK